MKKIFIIAFVALIAPFAASAQSNVDQLPSISINMSCDTLVAPDLFKLSILIIDNKGAGKAGIDNVEKKTLVPVLKSLGIDTKKDLVISNFYSTYDKKGNAVASKNYTLTVKSVALLNQVMEKLTSEDIQVTVSSAEVSNSDAISDVLRARAMKGAKVSAAQILEAADCRVGKLLNVSANAKVGRTAEMDGYVVTGMMMARKSANAPSEGVDTYRKINISAYLTVTYEIINK